MAANRGSKLPLKIREPNTIRPAIRTDFYRMAAFVVGSRSNRPRTRIERISASVILCGRVINRLGLICDVASAGR
jgi:hypothetical protein